MDCDLTWIPGDSEEVGITTTALREFKKERGTLDTWGKTRWSAEAEDRSLQIGSYS